MTSLMSDRRGGCCRTAGVAPPTWSAHPYTDADRAAVLDMFTEADFRYRTERPDTLAESDVLALLDEARVLVADGRPVGLYALERVGGEHSCHYQLHLRLRADVPEEWWRGAYREIVRCARWRAEVVRLALIVEESDERFLRIARSFGLTEEGTLARTTVHSGARLGRVHLAQIWAPQR